MFSLGEFKGTALNDYFSVMITCENTLLITAIALFTSCTEQQQEGQKEFGELVEVKIFYESDYQPGEEIKAFEGSYYFCEFDEVSGEITLEEACWTRSLTLFEIKGFAGSEGSYYINWDPGHRADMYFIIETEMHGDTLMLKTKYDNPDETSDVSPYRDMSLVKVDHPEDLWAMGKGEDADYLIKVEDKDLFPFIACVVEREMTEEFMIDEIVKLLHNLRDSQEEDIYRGMIPEEGIVLESPGPGVHPIIDTIADYASLSNMDLFHTSAYTKLMENVQLHVKEEAYFINVDVNLPDRCNPKEAALYIEFHDMNTDTKTANAEIMLVHRNEESEVMYTYFMMSVHFEKELKIIQISTLDCGA